MTISSICRNLKYILLPPVLWLGVWQFAAHAVGQELLLPTPVSVLQTLLVLGCTPAFWHTVYTTLLRVLAGMLWGALAGIALAALTYASAWCHRLFAPTIRIIRAAPVVSFILFLLLWSRRGSVPAIVAGLMVLPVLWESTSRGLRETDGHLLELAKAYRFSLWKKIRLIYLPSALPYFFSSAASAIGLAWKSGVAAETICLAPVSIGLNMQQTKLYLDTPGLFAWTAVVVTLSLVLEGLLTVLSRRLERRWKV